MIGQRLDHYRIESQLGAGGMGVVYLAVDEQLDRKVALKVLATGVLANEHARKQFKQEALALARLNHPNIETIYEFGSQDGLDFLVMELIPGAPLSEKLKEGPLTEREVLRLGIQLCEGLSAAHEQGIIHRDLKPANLFLTPENRLKILDFGLASLLKPQTEEELAKTISQEYGKVAGTLPYMSPEQLRGEPLDAKSDIYSAGAVLYEMATGFRPFPQSSSVQLIGAILHKEPVPLRTFHEHFPPGLEAVIMKSLEKEATERYQTARELRTALEMLITFSGTAQVALPSGTKSRESAQAAAVGKGSFGWKWPAIGGAALAAILGGLLLVDPGGIREKIFHPRQPESRMPGASTAVPVPVSRNAIAVLPLVNAAKRPEEAWLSTTLPEMLTTELGAGGNLRAVSGEEVTRMIADLGLPNADSYGGETLERIAKILGVGNIVTGSYLAPGTGQVRLDLRLQNARTGETVDTISVTGNGEQVSDLVQLVNRAGGELRQKLGVEGNPPSAEEVVKASVPATSAAAQAYAEGIERLRRMDAKGAVELLQKVVDKSPDFALGHSALAEAWSILGYDDRALEQEQKALALAGSLPTEDRGLIQGRSYEFASEWDKAATYYLSLRTLYQDDLDYGLRQANAQIRGGKPKEAQATLAELRSIPGVAADDPRIELREAEAAEMIGDFKAQEAAAAKAAASASRQGSRRLAASSEWHRCTALVNLGDSAAAKAGCEKARDAARSVEDRLLEARSLTGLGYALSGQGDSKGALACHQEALKLARGIGAQRDVAGALLNAANLIYASGDLKTAHRYYQESLETSRAINNKQGILDAEGGLAADLAASGEPAAALQIFGEMLKTARDVGDQKNAAFALEGAGLIQFEQGHLADARKSLEEMAKLTEQAGMEADHASALSTLGDLDLAQDRLDAASKSYDEAQRISQQLGDAFGQAASHAAFAALALEQGNPADAEKLAMQAADAFHAQNNADSETDALATAARAAVAEKNFAEARRLVERGKALPAQDQAIRMRLALSEVRVLAGEGKQAEAERLVNEWVSRAGERKWKRSELDARLTKAEIEASQENTAGAARAAAKRIQSEAAAAGFGLIARNAGNISK